MCNDDCVAARADGDSSAETDVARGAANEAELDRANRTANDSERMNISRSERQCSSVRCIGLWMRDESRSSDHRTGWGACEAHPITRVSNRRVLQSAWVMSAIG